MLLNGNSEKGTNIAKLKTKARMTVQTIYPHLGSITSGQAHTLSWGCGWGLTGTCVNSSWAAVWFWPFITSVIIDGEWIKTWAPSQTTWI